MNPCPVSGSGDPFRPSCLIFLLAAASPCLAQPGGPPAPTRMEQLAAAALSPEILPKVLAEGAANLQGKIKLLESRLTESQQQLAQTQQDLKNLQVAVASLRAALAVAKPPLTQVQELLATYAVLETQAKERSRTLAAESEALKQEIAADTVAAKHPEESGGRPPGRRGAQLPLPRNCSRP